MHRSLVLALTLVPVSASAADVDVCATCDQTTIAAGIEAAGPGGTVWVAPGVYVESVTVGHSVSIRSTGGSAVTRWHGASTNLLTVGAPHRLTLTGFSLHPWDGTNSSFPLPIPTAAPSRAILITGGGATLQDLRVSRHTSPLDGAALHISDAIVTLSASHFTELTAAQGGAISLNNSTLVSTDNRLVDNVADSGGALACSGSIVSSTRDTLTGNLAASDTVDVVTRGGAIDSDGCNLVLRDARLADNSATQGGHIATRYSVLAVEDSLVASGIADKGGALWFSGGSLQLSNGLWQANHANLAGGAVCADLVDDADLGFSGPRFRANTTDGLGGAVRLLSTVPGSTVGFVAAEFSGNEATNAGGAISTRGIDAIDIERSVFIDNGTTGAGAGGGAVKAELGDMLTVQSSYFCDNSAVAGGAIAFDGNDAVVTLAQSVFAHNDASNAGALLLDDTLLNATQNTFYGNTVSSRGPVAFLRDGSLMFRRNIVWPTPLIAGAVHTTGVIDRANSDENLWWEDLDHSFSGALSPQAVNGPNEIEGDPLFTGLAGDACATFTWELDDNNPGTVISPGVGATSGVDALFIDHDGDGYAPPVDCDDSTHTISPASTETCNGRDDDCNGLTDDLPSDAVGTPQTTRYYDADDDGVGGDLSIVTCVERTRYVSRTGDCNDADRSVLPGAVDAWYDGIDQDCDGADDFDQDGDGYPLTDDAGTVVDCNDTNPRIHPDAVEIWYDTVDQNCDGANDFDQDGDGVSINDIIGDCNDTDASIYPFAQEQWYDGIDQDCDGADDYDQDADGDRSDQHGGGDCDDQDPGVSSLLPEQWYDGIDQDCDGASDFDRDADGYDIDNAFTLPIEPDCDDDDPTIHPNADEVAGDGIDQDCSGFDWVDADGDGFAPAWVGGTDCDDSDATVNPDGVEIPYDGVDQDCSGSDLADVDRDGFDAVAAGGSDCDDEDPDVHPGAEEVWYDGIDQDCDGASDFDHDRDGWDQDAGDCDDDDPDVHPDASDSPNSGVDANCDGFATVSRITGMGCSVQPGAPALGLVFIALAGLVRRRRR